jgi:hypothetical protein
VDAIVSGPTCPSERDPTCGINVVSTGAVDWFSHHRFPTGVLRGEFRIGRRVGRLVAAALRRDDFPFIRAGFVNRGDLRVRLAGLVALGARCRCPRCFTGDPLIFSAITYGRNTHYFPVFFEATRASE